MTWKKLVLHLVHQFCETQGQRTFSLKDFAPFVEKPLADFAPNNVHRHDKLRQTLQFLRDDGLIAFVDGRGTYTLLGVDLLTGEVEPEAEPIIREFKGSPVQREYLVEVYARNRGWVKQARSIFGLYCMCEGCTNSFIKEDGTPYCEIHHIVPLFQNGEDWIENLSVLCAHHHRMAHFAALPERLKLQNYLLDYNKRILEEKGYESISSSSTAL